MKRDRNMLTGVELVAVALFFLGYEMIALMTIVVTLIIRLVVEIKNRKNITSKNNILEIVAISIILVGAVVFLVKGLM